MKQLKSKILISLTLVFSLYTLAKPLDFDFQQVFPHDGVDFISVTGIVQDDYGYIWFSTKNGLFKYDGNQLVHFAKEQGNPNSIPSDFLLCLTLDKNGEIWCGTLGEGLIRYNPETNIFSHYISDANNPQALLNDSINAILYDKQGKLWVATQQGLDQFDPETNAFTHFQSNKNDSTTLSDRQVRSLFEDEAEILWVGTGSPFPNNGGTPSDGGLNRYNRKTGNFTRFMHNTNKTGGLSNNKIMTLFEDNIGNFWLGTADNQLHQINRKDGTITPFPSNPDALGIPNKDERNRLDFIHNMIQDNSGGYWVGTKRSGLYYFSSPTNEIVQVMGLGNKITDISDMGIRSALIARDGTIWIGSDQGNLFYAAVSQKKIPHTPISTAPVTYFFEENKATLWIATTNDLMRINKNTQDTTRYVKELGYSKNSETYIHRMMMDHDENKWFSCKNGLFKFDDKTATFTRYQNDPTNNSSISDSETLVAFEDHKNNFWVGTVKGLNLMDRETGTFINYYIHPLDTIRWKSNAISCILEDKQNNLWVSAWNKGGVNLFNRDTKTFKKYLRGESIALLYIDSDDGLWAAGLKGLFKYLPDTDNFVRIGDTYTLKGLTDIFAINEDNYKNLWITTRQEIVRLDSARTITTIYNEKNGIARNSLSRFATLKKPSGEIYFGNKTGYYTIKPDDYLSDANPPELFISSFYISGQIIKPDKKGTLKHNIHQTKEIKLKYNQNVFSFGVSIIDYVEPNKNLLRYKLDGYDTDWIRANANRRANYFNVPPGEYVFRIKGANSNGVWAEKKIELTILPPWYQTWVAYGIYALLFIAFIFAFDRFQRKRIIKKERLKTHERERAQAKEIEKAYTELKSTQSQLIQSEKMASLGELTAGIAHEIQNPLNFVNNFAEVSNELIEEMNEELNNGDIKEAKEISVDIKQNLEKINHHGKRAESIVKGMLQHSRSSSGHKEPTDINILADEYLRLSYHGLRAKDKSFNAEFTLNADKTLAKINVVPQDIGRVILNLLNNAFYAVSEKKKLNKDGYKPTVSIQTKKTNNHVEISVKDNGNGIPQDALDKIFNPFFTTKPTGEGTGLGLSMSYDIITKGHNGQLKVETEKGNGTEFIILIPIST